MGIRISSSTTFDRRHRLRTGVLQAVAILFASTIRHRELVWQLFRRDFLASYKTSFIGWSWILMAPLAGVVSWVFLQRAHILHGGDTGVPYPAYVLVGSIMWGLFMNLYRGATNTLESYRYLILNVPLPHEVLFVAQALSRFADFSVSLAGSLVVLAVFHIVPSWGVLALPLLVAPLFLCAAGVGLLVCLATTVSYDLNRIVSGAMGLLMFATPVVYTAQSVGSGPLGAIVRWNPLTYLVCSCRDMLLFGHLYSTRGFVVASVFSVALFLIAWRVFYVTENRIAERML